MMKKLLILLALFTVFSSRAQDTLHIGQFDYYIANDTVNEGDSDSIEFWLINSGASAYVDSVYIVTEVMDTGGAFFIPVDTASWYDSIAAGDSVKRMILPTYNTTPAGAAYHYDINVIVIWPYGININSGDSLYYMVFVNMPDGVDEIAISELIAAYPNPAREHFSLLNQSSLKVEEVRILDSRGRLKMTSSGTDRISLEEFGAGMYVCEIRFSNGQRHSLRIIRQ